MKSSVIKTSYVVHRRPFIVGMGSMLGVFKPYYTYKISLSGHKSDAKAIASDFAAVGNDIRISIKIVGKAI